MILNRLKLMNFKSHSDTEIFFDFGISVIVGDNGSGKTSILEGISFALFKECSSDQDKLIKVNESVMSVTLDFSQGIRGYRVVRLVEYKGVDNKRRSSNSELYIKTDLGFSCSCSGDRVVTEEIEKILGVDGNLFVNAFYVKQGEIANLITEKPSERKKLIGRLMGIEDLEKCWRDMPEIIRVYENKRVKLEGETGELEGKIKILEDRRIDLEELKKQSSCLNEELNKKAKDLEELKNKKEEFDSKADEFKKVSGESDKKKGLCDVKSRRLSEIDAGLKEIFSGEEEIKKIKPEIDKISAVKNLIEKKRKINLLKEELQRIESDLRKISVKKENTFKLKEKYERFMVLEGEINHLRDESKVYEGSSVLREKFDNDILKFKKDLNRLNSELIKKTGEIKIIPGFESIDIQSIESIEKQAALMKDETEKSISENESKIRQKEEEINSLKGKNSEKKELIEKLNKAENKCPVCEKPLTKEHKTDLLSRYNDEVKENKDKINFINRECHESKAVLEKLKIYLKQVNSINVDALKDKKDECEKISANIRINLDELNKQKLLEEISGEISRKLKNLVLESSSLKDSYLVYVSDIKFLESCDEESKKEKISECRKNLDSEEKEMHEISGGISVSDAESELVRLENLKDKYNNLCGKVEKKELMDSEFKNIKKEILDLNFELSTLNEKLKSISYNEIKHKELKHELEASNENLNKLKFKEAGLRVKSEDLLSLINEKEKEIKSLEEKMKECEKIKNFLKILNEIRELFGKDMLQKKLRMKSIPVIQEYTREFFAEFDFEYSDLKVDEDYGITLYDSAGENTIDMISGGEKIAVALALRLGIAKALSSRGIELLILDEPTIHLDSQRRKELVEVFRKLKIPQMIIVTHDRELEEAADKICTLKKEGGKSKIY